VIKAEACHLCLLRGIKTIHAIICAVLIYFYSVLKTIKPDSLNNFKFPVIWDVLMSNPKKKNLVQSSYFFTTTIQNLKLRITKVGVSSCHMVFIPRLMKTYHLFQMLLCRNRCMGLMITNNHLPSETRKTDHLYNIWSH
jgi:hypothetical protein